MYAEQRYQPHAPRGASIGASLAISGAVMVALVYVSPDIVRQEIKRFVATNYEEPLPPPPDVPKPEPRPVEHPVTQSPKPYIPDPLVRTPSETTIDAVKTMPLDPPLIVPADPGPVTVVEKPRPVPPLLPAAQDPRFARDFQPQYPASELRAQRDGRVSVRVRIGADGRVKQVEQVSATSPAFFEATRRQALAKWRFKPATRGGVPEESWKVLNVRFEIANL